MVQVSNRSYQAPADHGPELNATDARAGERKGLYRVLGLSTFLALVVMGLVWLSVGSGAHVTSPHTGPDGQPASAAAR